MIRNMCLILGCYLDNPDVMLEFSKFNTYFGFDLFGLQNYLMPFDYPSDSQRINLMQTLLDELNCAEKIMISSDIHNKHALVS